MKGTILDYTASEAYVLLDDDSIITIPTTSLSQFSPVGSSINLSDIYQNSEGNYKPSNFFDKSSGLF